MEIARGKHRLSGEVPRLLGERQAGLAIYNRRADVGVRW